MTPEEILVQHLASAPDSTITSWDQLAEVPTLGLPLPIVKIWVDAETGFRHVTSLLATTAETDRAIGIQRPRDFDSSQNARAWFLAG